MVSEFAEEDSWVAEASASVVEDNLVAESDKWASASAESDKWASASVELDKWASASVE